MKVDMRAAAVNFVCSGTDESGDASCRSEFSEICHGKLRTDG